MGKFRGSAQNSTFHGKLWSLTVTIKQLIFTTEVSSGG